MFPGGEQAFAQLLSFLGRQQAEFGAVGHAAQFAHFLADATGLELEGLFLGARFGGEVGELGQFGGHGAKGPGMDIPGQPSSA